MLEKNYCPKFIFKILLLFFWATPLDYVLPHFGSATILLVLGLLISVFSVFDLAFRVGKIYFKSENLIIVFLFFLSLVSISWAENLYAAQTQLISYLTIFVMYFLLFSYRFSEKQYRAIEYASILGGVCLFVYVLTQVDMGLINAGYRLEFSALGSDAFSDPNGLAARLIMPYIFSIKAAFDRDKKWKRLFFLLSAGAIAYITFLSGSRAGVLALFAVTLLVMYKNMSVRHFGSLIGGLVGVVVMLLLLPRILPEHILNRVFEIDSYEAILSKEGDRIDIWKNLFTRVFPKSPIWGYGIGNSALAMKSVYYYLKATHNSWFVVLLEFGLLGFIPWVCFTYGKYKRAYALRTRDFYPLVIVIGTFLMAFTLDGVKEKYLWNAFLYLHMVASSYLPVNEANQSSSKAT